MHEQVQRIQTKIQQRLREISVLRKENEHIRKQLETLKAQQQEMQDNIDLLQQQNGILKASAGNMTEDDKKELQQNINKYLKDIDKCMALLAE